MRPDCRSGTAMTVFATGSPAIGRNPGPSPTVPAHRFARRRDPAGDALAKCEDGVGRRRLGRFAPAHSAP